MRITQDNSAKTITCTFSSAEYDIAKDILAQAGLSLPLPVDTAGTDMPVTCWDSLRSIFIGMHRGASGAGNTLSKAELKQRLCYLQ